MTSGVQTSVFSRLAHQAAAHYVKHGVYLPIESNLPSQLVQQQACFVSALEMPGRRLRALVGHVLPTQPTLAHEIVVHTVAAVSQKTSRKITRHDLQHVRFSVALLGLLQRISDVDHLSPDTHGLYVRSDRDKTALVMPDRVGVYSGSDQLATALREAQIDTRREAVTMYRFSVEHHDD